MILEALQEDINEQFDKSAKMIAYSFGTRYLDLICVLIPSKKGIKLGFNRGSEFEDPNQILQGKGKISRYLEFNIKNSINKPIVFDFLQQSIKLYQKKTL